MRALSGGVGQQQQQLLLLRRPPLTPLTPLQRPARHRALACVARRTIGGSSSKQQQQQQKQKQGQKQQAPQQQQQRVQAPPPPRSSSSSSSATPASRSGGSSSSSSSSQKQPASPPPPRRQQQQTAASSTTALGDFIRSTPVLNRFLDGTLLLGDAVMVLATEASSERLPYDALLPLSGVALGSWVVAAAALGDYAMLKDPDENPLSDALGWPIFAAVVNAMITWAVAMVLAVVGFSWLVSRFVVEGDVVLEVARDGQLSPQLEVSVALLVTMSCWRGMAARLRL